MKVLFVIENYAPFHGGVETVFRNLCEGLVKKGHDVIVVCQQRKGTIKKEVISGVQVQRVASFSRYLFPIAALYRAFSFARTADIVHTSTYTGAFPAWVAATLRKKPVIITVHEFLGKKWFFALSKFSAHIHELLERLVIGLPFTSYVCVSHNTRKNVVFHTKKKNIVTIHNGFDYDHWNPKKYDARKRKELGVEKNVVGLFYGRPGFSKGLEFLIKAIPFVTIPNFKLVAVVPQDAQYASRFAYIQQLVKELRVADKIMFLPGQAYAVLPYFIGAADMVIVPSLTEGFGYTTVESCAMNKPVVASNVDSIPEVIWGRYVLVEPKSPQSIAQGIIDMHNNKFTTAPKKMFLWEDTINRHLEVYNKWLSQ
jgi:D-inositol-3-phosphate glycosyltransferase